jgi:hypothetical protein
VSLTGFWSDELFETLFPPSFSAPEVTKATFPVDASEGEMTRLLVGFRNLKNLTLQLGSFNGVTTLPFVFPRLGGLEELHLHFVGVSVVAKCCPGCNRFKFGLSPERSLDSLLTGLSVEDCLDPEMKNWSVTEVQRRKIGPGLSDLSRKKNKMHSAE